MRMTFVVTGLTCQECADKLESHIQRMEGVEAAALLANGKFIIECTDSVAEMVADEVMKSAPKAQGDVRARRIS